MSDYTNYFNATGGYTPIDYDALKQEHAGIIAEATNFILENEGTTFGFNVGDMLTEKLEAKLYPLSVELMNIVTAAVPEKSERARVFNVIAGNLPEEKFLISKYNGWLGDYVVKIESRDKYAHYKKREGDFWNKAWKTRTWMFHG